VGAWSFAQFPFGPFLQFGGIAVLLFLYHDAAAVAGGEPYDADRLSDELDRTRMDGPLSKHLRHPFDVVYVRATLRVATVSAPAVVGVAVPSLLGPVPVFLWCLAIFTCGQRIEELLHVMVHNAPFRTKPQAPLAVRLFVSFCHHLTVFFVFPVHAKIYAWYWVQHNMNHHVENMGPEDTGCVVHYDRTSFLDLCRFAFAVTLDVMFGAFIIPYLRRHGRRAGLRKITRGLLTYYIGVGIVALFTWPAALMLVLARVDTGVGVASIKWFWHGLADPDDVQNIYRNSITMMEDDGTPLASLGSLEQHAQHHYKMGRHWSLYADDYRHTDWSEMEPGNVILPTPLPTMLGHMFARRYQDIGRLFVQLTPSWSEHDLRELVAHRLSPMRPVDRSATYQSLDRWVSAAASRTLVGPYSPR
jgi:hypothetical protein